MADYKIVNDIPLPPSRTPSQYPFHTMAVGDSFWLPPEEAKKAASAAWYHGRKNNKVFAIRMVGNGKGYRCWRTA